MGFYYYDYYFIALIIPALLFSMWAQYRVSSTFKKESQHFSMRGITGAQAARQILDANGLYNVAVTEIRGKLTDNYNPMTNTISLSTEVANSTSVASIGVAAHEVGHAIQYANSYAPIKLRAAIIPATKIGSMLSMPLILIGLLMSSQSLAMFGVILFSAVVFFQLVTLPVEYNASSRAMKSIVGMNILSEDEAKGARRVLSAAALTYLAALLTAIANLIRLLAIVGIRN